MTPAHPETVRTLLIERAVHVAAPLEVTFAAVLAEVGPESQMPDGTAFPFVLEAWPGGRWYRDLGRGAGHFWGHVQVIKPPTLLEICGPMFMSYPAMNFIQYRLAEAGGGTSLKITHRAMGLIPTEHAQGVQSGWDHGLKRIAEIALRSVPSARSR